jgi:AcrR family transcriptional regulator
MSSVVDDPLDGWELRRQRVAREIERTALTLFAQRGPESVTVEETAEAAGISIRTFFRYFASRDEILAATPRRELDELWRQVHSRPKSESLLEALVAAGHSVDARDPDDRELLLLFGIVAHRSPEQVMRGISHSMTVTNEVFQAIVSERLGLDPSDRRAGLLGAALSGVVGFTYSEWVTSGGSQPLGELLAESLGSIRDLLADSAGPSRSEPRREPALE